MRCPRPTVNMLLMARTPTSNIFSIGARLNGLIGAEFKGAYALDPMGPSPSKGSPVASSTRPNKALPTGN